MKLYKTNILFNINKIVYTIVILNFLIFFSSNSNAQISSGTYTIGGTSPDYANFTAAVNDLNTNGVAGDGPVTFNIRNGTYTEIFTINQITNVSLTSNVVFQCTSGLVENKRQQRHQLNNQQQQQHQQQQQQP
jgi:hypothetical protein